MQSGLNLCHNVASRCVEDRCDLKKVGCCCITKRLEWLRANNDPHLIVMVMMLETFFQLGQSMIPLLSQSAQ